MCLGMCGGVLGVFGMLVKQSVAGGEVSKASLRDGKIDVKYEWVRMSLTGTHFGVSLPTRL